MKKSVQIINTVSYTQYMQKLIVEGTIVEDFAVTHSHHVAGAMFVVCFYLKFRSM